MGRELAGSRCPRPWTSSSGSSEAAGLDLAQALLRGHRGGARRDRAAAAGARRDEPGHPRRDSAPRGIKPDFVVGHSVGEFAALAAPPGALTRSPEMQSRSSASAGWRWPRVKINPGSMAAILGLDDEVVERICRRIANVWPANYNCPGQIVVSGRDGAVEEACEDSGTRGCAPRRPPCLRIGAFHSPLVAKAADRFRPALQVTFRGADLAPFMSTVTARIENAPSGLHLCSSSSSPHRFGSRRRRRR